MRKRTVALLTSIVAVALTGCSASKTTSAAAPSAQKRDPLAAAAAPFGDCVDAAQQAEVGTVLKTAGGLDLDALVLGTGKTGLVFAPQAEGDLCQWLPTAQLMAKNGYRTAVFNYSGDTGARDVQAAAAELRHRGVTSVAYVGASKGGTSALAAASGAGDVAAVVSLSAPSSFENVNALDGMAKVTAPTWFAVGSLDLDFANDTRDLYAASGATKKHLTFIDSRSHGVELLDAVRTEMTEFLQQYAPPVA